MSKYNLTKLDHIRISALGQYVMATASQKTGAVVDKGGDYSGKGDAYIEEVKRKFPLIELKKRLDGPVDNVETLIFGLKLPTQL